MAILKKIHCKKIPYPEQLFVLIVLEGIATPMEREKNCLILAKRAIKIVIKKAHMRHL